MVQPFVFFGLARQKVVFPRIGHVLRARKAKPGVVEHVETLAVVLQQAVVHVAHVVEPTRMQQKLAAVQLGFEVPCGGKEQALFAELTAFVATMASPDDVGFDQMVVDAPIGSVLAA